MDVYESIARYFQENNVAYREIHHAPGASTEEYHQAVGCRYEQQAKCLFLKVIAADGTYYVICAIPAQKKANLKAL
jgi:Ala-tRNA(Pro) deacylase